jgi:hypothetical protein
MNGAGGNSCIRSVLERESTGVEIAYVSTGDNFLTSDIRNNDSLVNLKVMRIVVFGGIERCHSRSKRLYNSLIDHISTDSSVHPVEMAIPKDLVSTRNTVALHQRGRLVAVRIIMYFTPDDHAVSKTLITYIVSAY